MRNQRALASWRSRPLVTTACVFSVFFFLQIGHRVSITHVFKVSSACVQGVHVFKVSNACVQGVHVFKCLAHVFKVSSARVQDVPVFKVSNACVQGV